VDDAGDVNSINGRMINDYVRSHGEGTEVSAEFFVTFANFGIFGQKF
jgi:hypothetical protein